MESRESRELQYSPSRWSHRFDKYKVISEHIRQLQEGSDFAKKTIECELGISYGLSANEKLDIFGAKTLPGEAPIVVYIHGGYWQHLSRELSSFCAPPVCKAGAVAISAGYDLAPKVGMDEIVSQVKRAVTFVLKFAERRGSRGVYLVGHSAGGHLVGMMLVQDWLTECMVNSSLIKGAVMVAGVFDLRPIVDTYINDPIKMSEEEATRNSPLLMKDQMINFSEKRKLLVVVGEHDSPEFKRQSIEMNNILLEGKVNSKFMIIPDTDHFNVIELLAREDYSLTREIIHLVGLNISTIANEMQYMNMSS